LDTTAATEALSQAEGQLREDQEALVVAQQKDAEAQRALMDATRQASDAADDEALTAFKANVLELEALLFGEMKRAVGDAGSLAESGWAWRRIKSPKGGTGTRTIGVLPDTFQMQGPLSCLALNFCGADVWKIF
jgi:multidrug efflux pump subunit AcrA (membrane-fusion protein)